MMSESLSVLARVLVWKQKKFQTEIDSNTNFLKRMFSLSKQEQRKQSKKMYLLWLVSLESFIFCHLRCCLSVEWAGDLTSSESSVNVKCVQSFQWLVVDSCWVAGQKVMRSNLKQKSVFCPPLT